MLHVWVVDHPCGPFAGIEADAASMPGRCLHAHGATTETSTTLAATEPGSRKKTLDRYFACLRLRGITVPEGPARSVLVAINFLDPTIRTAHDNCSAFMPPTVAALLGLADPS